MLLFKIGCKGANFYLSVQIIFQKNHPTLHKPPLYVQKNVQNKKNTRIICYIFDILLHLHKRYI